LHLPHCKCSQLPLPRQASEKSLRSCIFHSPKAALASVEASKIFSQNFAGFLDVFIVTASQDLGYLRERRKKKINIDFTLDMKK